MPSGMSAGARFSLTTTLELVYHGAVGFVGGSCAIRSARRCSCCQLASAAPSPSTGSSRSPSFRAPPSPRPAPRRSPVSSPTRAGAAVPGVTVTATNQATGVAYAAVSNEAGNYTITVGPRRHLRRQGRAERVPHGGDARRSRSRPGRSRASTSRWSVGAPQRDGRGHRAPSPILQTETATVGEVISGNTVASLPLNGRNTGQLALLLPGTMTYNPRGFTNIGSINMNRPFVNGNREQANNFTVDGLDVNETIDNRVAYQPSPDALAEISVETNNYSAEHGQRRRRGGRQRAQVGHATSSAATPSSSTATATSTRTRGRTTGRARPSRNARSTSSAARSAGRIARQKLFFFGDYQGSRQDAPGFGTASVAPEAWRRGDLSSVTTPIRDPLTGAAVPGQPDPDQPHQPGRARRSLNDTANYPLPNRDVLGRRHGQLRRRDAARRSARTRATPASTGTPRPTTSSSCATRSPPTRTRATSSRSRSSSRRATTSRSGTSAATGTASSARRSSTSCSSASATPRVIVGDLRLGRHRRRATPRYGIAGGQPIDGLTSIGWGSGLTAPGAIAPDSNTLAKTFQINEKLTWLKGRHALKFGGQWLRYDQQRFYAGNNGLLGFINYNGAFTGFAFSDFLLDMVVEQGPRRRRPERPVDAPAEPHRALRAGRLQADAEPDAEPRHALGLHVAARREGQPAVELRPGDRRADLRDGRQHRGPRALRALLQGLRAAPRRGLEARATGWWSAAATASRSSWRAPAPTCACR